MAIRGVFQLKRLQVNYCDQAGWLLNDNKLSTYLESESDKPKLYTPHPVAGGARRR
jgi:hypothetical protein